MIAGRVAQPEYSGPELSGPELSGFLRNTASSSEADFLVRGARCAACLGKIERGVSALPGVDAARLNLTSGRLHVVWRSGGADPSTVLETVRDLGYVCAAFDPSEAQRQIDREGRELIIALGVAGFGVSNVMMFSVPVWAGLFGQELGEHSRQVMYWLSAIVATPCALYAGQPFFRSAWNALRRGKANMDVPITIGVLLTLAVSFIETARARPHAYFDAAVCLVFLLLIGRYLDHRLRASARSAAQDLLALQAPVARVLDEAGRAHGVPVSQVRAGDRLSIAAGERSPVDGVVIEGRADLDVSLITGETRTEIAAPGGALRAGSMSLNGHLVVEAAASAVDSSLAELARMMEVGAQSRGRYVRLADKAAAIYVPFVHSAAALTFVVLWWMGGDVETALVRAAAVLIVTCPCALGLAAPAVQVAASARLFRRGLLVKSGAALERLAEVDVVFFDKTGVLTEPGLVLQHAAAPALHEAAVLARASRHPLAKALAAAAGPGSVAADVREQVGLGVEGVVGDRAARLGSALFIGGEARPGDGAELWFAVGDDPPVRFGFVERLRPGAAEAIEALQRLDIAVEILSGDRPGAVRPVAEAVGVAGWRAGLTPDQKAGLVRDYARDGWKVLMVGDGLNDAGALALAHASMAPGEASDASQNAADLVFVKEALTIVPEAILCARRARRRALENFAFSALYNLAAVPAAMAGWVTPLFAALAMSGSSIVVMLNAGRMSLEPVAGWGAARWRAGRAP